MDEKSIKKFYDELDRGAKGRFLLWIQSTLEISQTTALLRIKNDEWKAIERDAVLNGIESESWKK